MGCLHAGWKEQKKYAKNIRVSLTEELSQKLDVNYIIYISNINTCLK